MTVARTASANDPPQVVMMSSFVILSCASRVRGTKKFVAEKPATAPAARSRFRRVRRHPADRNESRFDMTLALPDEALRLLLYAYWDKISELLETLSINAHLRQASAGRSWKHSERG